MSFSKTCKNIQLDGNTGILSANCLDGTGDYPYSAICLNDYIRDDNGLLRWGRGGGFMSYGRSRSVYLQGGTVLMKAECRKSNETWTNSDIDLDKEITNDNGRLTYHGQ